MPADAAAGQSYLAGLDAYSPWTSELEVAILWRSKRIARLRYRNTEHAFMLPLQDYKEHQLRTLPSGTGVYALCDLGEIPIYVGQSIDGIRARVHRHLTSARSDVMANRQIDVWEFVYVWACPMLPADEIAQSEPTWLTMRCCLLFHPRISDIIRSTSRHCNDTLSCIDRIAEARHLGP